MGLRTFRSAQRRRCAAAAATALCLCVAIVAAPASATVATGPLTTAGPLFPSGPYPSRLAFSSDGAFLVSGDNDAGISVFSVSTNGLLARTDTIRDEETQGARPVAFKPGSHLLVAADSKSNALMVYSIASNGTSAPVGQPLLLDDDAEADELVFSPDGTRLAALDVSHDQLRLFTVSSRGVLASAGLAVSTGSGYVTHVAFSPDGKWVAVGGWSSEHGEIRMYSISASGAPSQIGDPVAPAATTDSLAFSPDGKRLVAAATYEAVVSTFRVSAAGALTPESELTSTRLWSLTFTPDGRYVTGVRSDNTLGVLRVNTSGDLSSLGSSVPIAGGIGTQAVSPDGRFVAATSYPSGVAMFALSDGGALTRIGAPTATPSEPGGIAFPATTRVLTTNTGANSLSMFTLGADGTTAPVCCPLPTGAQPGPIAVSSQGLIAAGNYQSPSISLFGADLWNPTVLPALTGLSANVHSLAFNPAGTALAVASISPGVTVYPVGADARVTTPGVTTVPQYAIGNAAVTYSPDGHLLAITNDFYPTVSTLTVGSGGALTPASTAGVGGDYPEAVAFSPNSRLLATTTVGVGSVQPSIVSVYSVSAAGALALVSSAQLSGYYSHSVAFSPDGRSVAALSTTGVALFAVDPAGHLTAAGDPAYPARGLQTVAFTPDGRFVAATDSVNDQLLVLPLTAESLDTYISSGPPAATASRSASFAFDPNYPSTLTCRIDSGAWTPCSGQQDYNNLAEGSHTFTVRATDLTGSVEASPAQRTWVVDLTPPLIPNATTPASGASALPATTPFSWAPTTDALTSIDHYELWIDGAQAASVAPSACATTCTVTPDHPLEDGSHSWSVHAIDAAGNVATGPERSFTIDAAPPDVFALATPADNAWLATSRPQLSWTAAADSGAGVAHYEVRLDDETVAAAVAPGTTSWTPDAALPDGTHHWQVVAVDANGNRRASVRQAFVVDTTPPRALLVAAPNPALSGHQIDFDASASAGILPDAIARYEWDLDGDGTYETTTDAPHTSRSYTTSAALTMPVGLRVVDRAGLTATASGSVRVYPPSTPKPPGITINDQARYTRDANVTLSVVAPSFATDIDIANDGSFLSAKTVGVMAKIPWKLDAANADHEATTVYVRFTRGLIVSDPYTDDIILDRSPPVISAASKAVHKGQVVVDLTARDKGLSGIGGVQVTNNKKHPPARYTDARFRAQRVEIRLRKSTRKTSGKAHRSAAAASAPAVDTTRPIYVRVRDKAGNVSAWRTVRGR